MNYQKIEELYILHGATCYDAPILTPVTKNTNLQEYPYEELLNKGGMPVYLPYELCTPFIRDIARKHTTNFKRYTISNVYLKRSDEVHPEQSFESCYDIIYKHYKKEYIIILFIVIIIVLDLLI